MHSNSTSRSATPKLRRRSSSISSSQSIKQDTRVQVFVRARPLETSFESETSEASSPLEFPSDKEIKLIDPKQETTYRFDHVFSPTTTNKEVCQVICSPLIDTVLHGYNGSFMVYGQTGTGKTFTVQAEDGLIPTTIAQLFNEINNDNENEYTVYLSYLQIYHERIYDLLDSSKDTDLHLREHPEEGVIIEGLAESKITSTKDAELLLEYGRRQLIVAETKMVRVSSRSHSVCILRVQKSKRKPDLERSLSMHEEIVIDAASLKAEEAFLKGKLYLCDLAGSERLKKSGVTGDRLKEARYINTSLLELGNVIHALSVARGHHVPFRNSTLTRILKESLGGNSRASLMICISSSIRFISETKCSLNFGQRALRVTKSSSPNIEPTETAVEGSTEALTHIAHAYNITKPRHASGLYPKIDYKALSEYLAKKLKELELAYQNEKQNYRKMQEEIRKSKKGQSKIPVLRSRARTPVSREGSFSISKDIYMEENEEITRNNISSVAKKLETQDNMAGGSKVDESTQKHLGRKKDLITLGSVQEDQVDAGVIHKRTVETNTEEIDRGNISKSLLDNEAGDQKWSTIPGQTIDENANYIFPTTETSLSHDFTPESNESVSAIQRTCEQIQSLLNQCEEENHRQGIKREVEEISIQSVYDKRKDGESALVTAKKQNELEENKLDLADKERKSGISDEECFTQRNSEKFSEIKQIICQETKENQFISTMERDAEIDDKRASSCDNIQSLEEYEEKMELTYQGNRNIFETGIDNGEKSAKIRTDYITDDRKTIDMQNVRKPNENKTKDVREGIKTAGKIVCLDENRNIQPSDTRDSVIHCKAEDGFNEENNEGKYVDDIYLKEEAKERREDIDDSESGSCLEARNESTRKEISEARPQSKTEPKEIAAKQGKGDLEQKKQLQTEEMLTEGKADKLDENVTNESPSNKEEQISEEGISKGLVIHKTKGITENLEQTEELHRNYSISTSEAKKPVLEDMVEISSSIVTCETLDDSGFYSLERNKDNKKEIMIKRKNEWLESESNNVLLREDVSDGLQQSETDDRVKTDGKSINAGIKNGRDSKQEKPLDESKRDAERRNSANEKEGIMAGEIPGVSAEELGGPIAMTNYIREKEHVISSTVVEIQERGDISCLETATEEQMILLSTENSSTVQESNGLNEKFREPSVDQSILVVGTERRLTSNSERKQNFSDSIQMRDGEMLLESNIILLPLKANDAPEIEDVGTANETTTLQTHDKVKISAASLDSSGSLENTRIFEEKEIEKQLQMTSSENLNEMIVNESGNITEADKCISVSQRKIPNNVLNTEGITAKAILKDDDIVQNAAERQEIIPIECKFENKSSAFQTEREIDRNEDKISIHDNKEKSRIVNANLTDANITCHGKSGTFEKIAANEDRLGRYLCDDGKHDNKIGKAEKDVEANAQHVSRLDTDVENSIQKDQRHLLQDPADFSSYKDSSAKHMDLLPSEDASVTNKGAYEEYQLLDSPSLICDSQWDDIKEAIIVTDSDERRQRHISVGEAKVISPKHQKHACFEKIEDYGVRRKKEKSDGVSLRSDENRELLMITSKMESLQSKDNNAAAVSNQLSISPTPSSGSMESEFSLAIKEKEKLQKALGTVKNQYEDLLQEFDKIIANNTADSGDENVQISKESYQVALKCKEELELEIRKAREQLAVVQAAQEEQSDSFLWQSSDYDYSEDGESVSLDVTDEGMTIPRETSTPVPKITDTTEPTSALKVSYRSNAVQTDDESVSERGFNDRMTPVVKEIGTNTSPESEADSVYRSRNYRRGDAFDEQQDDFGFSTLKPSEMQRLPATLPRRRGSKRRPKTLEGIDGAQDKWLSRRSLVSKEQAKRNQKLTMQAIENAELKKELLLTKLEKIRLEAMLSCVMMRVSPTEVEEGFRKISVNSITSSSSTLRSTTSLTNIAQTDSASPFQPPSPFRRLNPRRVTSFMGDDGKTSQQRVRFEESRKTPSSTVSHRSSSLFGHSSLLTQSSLSPSSVDFDLSSYISSDYGSTPVPAERVSPCGQDGDDKLQSPSSKNKPEGAEKKSDAIVTYRGKNKMLLTACLPFKRKKKAGKRKSTEETKDERYEANC